MIGKFDAVATTTAFVGRAIPAHDETLDLATAIGKSLDEFHAYIVSVRSEAQADEAVTELLTALLEAHQIKE